VKPKIDLRKIKKGDTIRFFYGQKGNPNNRLVHVRAIVDGQFVIRKWRREKGWWSYSIESPFYLRMSIEGGDARVFRGRREITPVLSRPGQ